MVAVAPLRANDLFPEARNTGVKLIEGTKGGGGTASAIGDHCNSCLKGGSAGPESEPDLFL